MSRTSVVRILSAKELRPHRVKMWLHSPAPQFREKVTDICDLYREPPPGAVVLCVDEKTGMQALGRKHPVRGPEAGRDRRMDYEYVRNGTRKLLAAFDPHSGELYAEAREGRTAEDILQFMEEIAAIYPDKEVHIVWDNLNIHHDGPDKRWTEFNARHGGRFHFHYTPVHASWVNQVELFFGIMQKWVLRHGVFDSLEALDEAVIGFIDHWNEHERHPFKWTFKGYRSRRKRAA
jgi:transposase